MLSIGNISGTIRTDFLHATNIMSDNPVEQESTPPSEKPPSSTIIFDDLTHHGSSRWLNVFNFSLHYTSFIKNPKGLFLKLSYLQKTRRLLGFSLYGGKYQQRKV